jgi:NAD(P)-dependent dehydrogenase (short-subunit alcohol dehydrogenase family)
MSRVDGKIAIVTGAGSGIGASSAEALAEGGAYVVVTDIKDGQATVKAILKSGGKAEFCHQDVTDEGQWKSLVEDVCVRHGGLDILVNNAGVGVVNQLKDTTLEQWEFIMRVNGSSVFLGTKYGIWGMTEGSTKRPKGGSIINISSVAGLVGAFGESAYSASKGAVAALTRVAAVECGKLGTGVRVNTVCPGIIQTPMLDDHMEMWAKMGWGSNANEVREALKVRIPINRIADSREVGNAVRYLASDDASYITGVALPVDGGLSASL